MNLLPAVAAPIEGSWLAGVLGRCAFPDPSGGPVTLAVSGGADSTALMVLAGRAGLSGTVVHVDHGLRPGSASEGDYVAQVAAGLGFEFRQERVEVGAGPDLEARARRARYAVLPAGVLTGHTMDDQAETILLNVLRGAALDGLAGMRHPARPWPGGRPGPDTGAGVGLDDSFDSLVDRQEDHAGSARTRRPLLGLRRSETVEVCRRSRLDPLADPSNQDDRFRRNRVRSELLPLVNLIAERDVVPVLARQGALLADDAELLDDLAAAVDPTDVAALRSAPAPLARRALRSWLRAGAERHPPTAAELARVMDVAAGHHQACQLAGGRRVARSGGRLYLQDSSCREEPE
ncbi:MAG TPA: tRNA lysidine(34) synthetase TilS [Acidimicrobiales bacterium]|nr:tRNA lysidine(34) synthetase TilS [Acidimicrobiales bacterium]